MQYIFIPIIFALLYHCFNSGVAGGAAYLGEVGALGQVGEVEVFTGGTGGYGPGAAVYHAACNIVHANVEVLLGFAGVADGKAAAVGVGEQDAVHSVHALSIYGQVAHHAAQCAVSVYLAMAPQVVAGKRQGKAGKGIADGSGIKDGLDRIGRKHGRLLQHHSHNTRCTWRRHRGAGKDGKGVCAATGSVVFDDHIVVGTAHLHRWIERANG